ncbi:hypothetical protein HDV04_003392 [Boothiomyces sp. JEL0838]|nr:hypothetical protein HDV04_003392 [Boothiomyces sp. JEL0838]
MIFISRRNVTQCNACLGFLLSKWDNESVFTALQFMLSENFPIDKAAYCNAMMTKGTRILDLLYHDSSKLTVNVFKEAVLSDELEKAVWPMAV